jgi:peptidoglycan hydrolase-like protein with peptidoglycan-binding domain
MSNSALVAAWSAAPNHSSGRFGERITEITVHHAATTALSSVDATFKNRAVSAHYGVQYGIVHQYVDESDMSWANGHISNRRAVTIETVNSGVGPDWAIADDTLETLCHLVADIAKRNALGALAVGTNLTYHSQYVATACPGPWLKARLQYVADRANFINAGGVSGPVAAPAAPMRSRPVLRYGAHCDEVKAIQTAVGADADGWWGDKTESAFRAYQLAYGLAVDGVCGPASWAAIDSGKTLAAAPAVATVRLIRRGSVNTDVKSWQLIIGAAVDGDFGPETERLTKAWQSAHGLAADGIVGPATWGAAGYKVAA